MKPMTYEEARRYIAGEQFNSTDWERQHIIRLAKSVRIAIENGVNTHNLRKTASHYIQIHCNTINRKELQDLIDAYNAIPE